MTLRILSIWVHLGVKMRLQLFLLQDSLLLFNIESLYLVVTLVSLDLELLLDGWIVILLISSLLFHYVIILKPGKGTTLGIVFL